jgi:hypothetical protein
VNLTILNKHVPGRAVPRALRFVQMRGRLLAGAAGVLAAGFGFAGQALAQAASPTGGLGDQIKIMSSEGLNAGSTVFGAVCYLAAAVCFFFGVWAAWQSRQPQNRETGFVGRAMAGLALCGLFATDGVWINKAAITATGAAATISTTPGMVTFGG